MRLEAGYQTYEATGEHRSVDGQYMLSILLAKSTERLFDSEYLVGFSTFNDRELRELMLLKDDRLVIRVRQLLLGPWGNDDLKSDAQVIQDKISQLAFGWRAVKEYENPVTFMSSRMADGSLGELVFSQGSLSTSNEGVVTTDSDWRIDRDELGRLLSLPSLERGAEIARKLDAWDHWLAASIQ